MHCKTIDIISLSRIILPAILTTIGNIIFYLWIKKRVDRSIEQYKITYSGIFKEKIDIYREILDKSYRIKSLINRYHLTGDDEKGSEFIREIEEFINYYLKNQPFLSENMLDQLKKIRVEFQSIFDDSHQYYYLSKATSINKKTLADITRIFFKTGNKFKTDNPFNKLETVIIKEMRADLKIDNFKR